jgi:hypothetical protein
LSTEEADYSTITYADRLRQAPEVADSSATRAMVSTPIRTRHSVGRQVRPRRLALDHEIHAAESGRLSAGACERSVIVVADTTPLLYRLRIGGLAALGLAGTFRAKTRMQCQGPAWGCPRACPSKAACSPCDLARRQLEASGDELRAEERRIRVLGDELEAGRGRQDPVSSRRYAPPHQDGRPDGL